MLVVTWKTRSYFKTCVALSRPWMIRKAVDVPQEIKFGEDVFKTAERAWIFEEQWYSVGNEIVFQNSTIFCSSSFDGSPTRFFQHKICNDCYPSSWRSTDWRMEEGLWGSAAEVVFPSLSFCRRVVSSRITERSKLGLPPELALRVGLRQLICINTKAMNQEKLVVE